MKSLIICVLMLAVSQEAATVQANAATFKEFMTAHARYHTTDNLCTESWEGPSPSNSFECPSSVSPIVDWVLTNGIHWRLTPMLIGFLTLVPIAVTVLLCRYRWQRCGGSRMRPDAWGICPGDIAFDDMDKSIVINHHYSFTSTCAVKMMTIVPIMLGLVAVGLCVHGGREVADGLDQAIGAVNETMEFFVSLGEDSIDNIINPLDDTDIPLGFNRTVFTEYISDMRQTNDDILEQTVSTRRMVHDYAIYPAYIVAVPCGVMIFGGLAALLNIRSFLPLVVILLSFFMQFVYFALGSAILLALVPLYIACDEVSATYNPDVRGVIHWYAIPKCEDSFPFQTLLDQIDVMENETSQEVCSRLTSICDTTLLWNVGDPQRVFYCNVTSGSQCQTFETAAGTVSAMILKPTIATYSFFGTTFETCGGNADNCTLRRCATSCDRDEVRSSAKLAVDVLDTLVRIKTTFNTILRPWLNCTKLAVKVVESGPTQVCVTTTGGFGNIADGCMVCGTALLLTIIVCFMGQKRFACAPFHPPLDPQDEKNDVHAGVDMQEHHHNPLGDETPAKAGGLDVSSELNGSTTRGDDDEGDSAIFGPTPMPSMEPHSPDDHPETAATADTYGDGRIPTTTTTVTPPNLPPTTNPLVSNPQEGHSQEEEVVVNNDTPFPLLISLPTHVGHVGGGGGDAEGPKVQSATSESLSPLEHRPYP